MSGYPYFSGDCVLRYDPAASKALGGDYWRHMSDYKLVLSPRQWAHVSRGSLTDKGSVPRIAWPVVPRDGKFEQAYGLHDQLCEYLSLTVDGRPSPISRTRADQLLYVAMDVLGATEQDLAPVRAAVEAHRLVLNVTRPTNTALKRKLEAQWREE